MKNLLILSAILILCLHGYSQPLKVQDASHFLTDTNGGPFFWLADTGWELFHRLDRDEAERYIIKRKIQGFNIIQAVVLYELQAFESPNAYGDFPLIGKDISQLNVTTGNSSTNPEEYDYWDHVKYIVEVAAKHNMIIGLLPCWGEYVTPRFRERIISNLKQGYHYGSFIGHWLKEYNNNIIWILGGDRLPDEKPKGVDIWRAMAEGITDAVSGEDTFNFSSDYSSTFMTYHCYASSSKWFAEDDWIDMHTWGSYHEKRNNERAYYISWSEWAIKNTKPFVNSEPAYENLPINYDWADVSNGRFDDFDVRQIAYWSVFSGCAGHTYGGHEVWMMYKEENQFLPLTKHNINEWELALDYKGANEMKYLKELMLSYDYFSRKPNLEIIADNPDDPMGKLIACSGEGYCMVYSPTGKNIVVDTSKIAFTIYTSQWFNPKNGTLSKANYSSEKDCFTYNPPGEIIRGNDWVLILSAGK